MIYTNMCVFCLTILFKALANNHSLRQGGITCGAIDEPRKSSKAIDERVIINFRDKNVVIARFRNKNVYQQLFCSIDRFSVLSKAFLFYRKLFCSIHIFSVHKYGKYI